MTVCNMSIEGGARIGYVNPDQVTIDYIKGREFAPVSEAWTSQVQYWQSIRSSVDAEYDDCVNIDGATIEPMVTWGITPAQSIPISQKTPVLSACDPEERAAMEAAYAYMKWKPGQAMKGQKINVGFIGSCTNSRLSDLAEVAAILAGKTIHPDVKLLVVPGSQPVKDAAEQAGYDQIIKEAAPDANPDARPPN